MADLVALPGIEEHDLIGFSHRLTLPDVTNVHASVREYELSARGALFRTLVCAGPLTMGVSDRDRPRAEQRIRDDFRHAQFHHVSAMAAVRIFSELTSGVRACYQYI